MTKKPAIEQLIADIHQYKGNLSAVARHYRVERITIYRWMKDSAKCQQALEDARETMLDNAESVLYKKVLDGSTPELLFFLKSQGKKRGYVERQEVTGTDGGPVKLTLTNLLMGSDESSADS